MMVLLRLSPPKQRSAPVYEDSRLAISWTLSACIHKLASKGKYFQHQDTYTTSRTLAIRRDVSSFARYTSQEPCWALAGSTVVR